MTTEKSFFQKPQFLNCKGRLLDLSRPQIMGILNVTPDSFFDGGQHNSLVNALKQVEKMLTDGATIIDIGGMSSRPGAEIIGTDEELKRVIPIIEKVNQTFPEAILSIDTVKSKVAKESINAGAHIVNDISAGSIDSELIATVGKLGVPYILMHIQGKPENMQDNPNYENVVLELIDFFQKKVALLKENGIKDIVLDVGFGFGKTVEHNYELLKEMNQFKVFERPILVGLSRKSMICKVLKTNPDKALNGTTALHAIALLNGANILRVHDVKEAVQVIELLEVYKGV